MHSSEFETLCGWETYPSVSLNGVALEPKDDLSVLASHALALIMSIFQKMAYRRDAGAVSEWVSQVVTFRQGYSW